MWNTYNAVDLINILLRSPNLFFTCIFVYCIIIRPARILNKYKKYSGDLRRGCMDLDQGPTMLPWPAQFRIATLTFRPNIIFL